MLKPVPYGGEIKRNIVGHIWPTKNGVWRTSVAYILRRADLFNGQKIISVVTDDSTDKLADVKAAFAGMKQVDFLHFKNNPVLGEVVSFEELLHRVESIATNELTYYFHAKGSKYRPGEQPMVKHWVDVMHANMLDYPSLIEDSLRSHAICGTFIKSGNQFGGLDPSWHAAGTFLWFRNAAIFGSTLWRRIPKTWWGTEAWPGIVCPREHADCLMMEGMAPTMQLYRRDYWKNEVNPKWLAWQVYNCGLHRHNSYSEVFNTLKLTNVKKIVVAGPQRSGTMIAAKILAHDLKLPFHSEIEFDTHDFMKFMKLIQSKESFVVQAPSMSAYVHQLPCTAIWMQRSHQDVLRSERRIKWGAEEQLERNRYFTREHGSSAAIKHEAWERFQRIELGERAFDLSYDSLSTHPLWVPEDGRKEFGPRQTKPEYPNA
jgi:hypothetical protein